MSLTRSDHEQLSNWGKLPAANKAAKRAARIAVLQANIQAHQENEAQENSNSTATIPLTKSISEEIPSSQPTLILLSNRFKLVHGMYPIKYNHTEVEYVPTYDEFKPGDHDFYEFTINDEESLTSNVFKIIGSFKAPFPKLEKVRSHSSKYKYDYTLYTEMCILKSIQYNGEIEAVGKWSMKVGDDIESARVNTLKIIGQMVDFNANTVHKWIKKGKEAHQTPDHDKSKSTKSPMYEITKEIVAPRVSRSFYDIFIEFYFIST